MQAMIASAFAKKDHYKVAATTARVLQLGVVLGAALTVILGLGMQFGAGVVFTKDAAVIKTIRKAVPVRTNHYQRLITR
jgi:Na+-translocating ferredoxin:NAD+ oxidoreductase RnfE subunit